MRKEGVQKSNQSLEVSAALLKVAKLLPVALEVNKVSLY